LRDTLREKQRCRWHRHRGQMLSTGIDNAEIIDTVHARRAPMIPASAGLRQPR
jgi:hypothetical protein